MEYYCTDMHTHTRAYTGPRVRWMCVRACGCHFRYNCACAKCGRFVFFLMLLCVCIRWVAMFHTKPLDPPIALCLRPNISQWRNSKKKHTQNQIVRSASFKRDCVFLLTFVQQITKTISLASRTHNFPTRLYLNENTHSSTRVRQTYIRQRSSAHRHRFTTRVSHRHR